MSGRLYSNISDAVNNVKFTVKIPDSYSPVVPEYYKKYPDRQPFFSGNQPYSYSKMTCADIVDLCNSEVQFVIVERSDVEIIVNMIKRYVSELEPLASGMNENSDPVIAIGRCNAALNILDFHNRRAIRERSGETQNQEGQSLQSILRMFDW